MKRFSHDGGSLVGDSQAEAGWPSVRDAVAVACSVEEVGLDDL